MSVSDWMAASAEPPDSGTADQSARKRVPFCLVGGSVTDGGDGPVADYDPRRSDILVVELR